MVHILTYQAIKGGRNDQIKSVRLHEINSPGDQAVPAKQQATSANNSITPEIHPHLAPMGGGCY